ncbi:MAG: hypothetical protein KTR32_03715 [Granulosicoccus sp.]|nr:hypothetical protein [Granulosicoccus sp.]
MRVVALIESLTPEAWVVDLIQRLNTRSEFQLTVASTQPTLRAAALSSDSEKSPPRLLDRAARWLLTHRIDRPLFTHNPRECIALPDTLVVKHLPVSRDLFSDCDVVIDLQSSDLQRTCGIDPRIPYWSALTCRLNNRVEDCLLDNAPLMWIHLWNIGTSQADSGCTSVPKTDRVCDEYPSDTTSDTTSDIQRIDSHSLPRHSFSINDLQRLCFSSLPALFESRLLWMAKNNGILDNLEKLEADQGVFQAESLSASTDALRWLVSDNEQRAARSTKQITRVVRLFFRQLKVRLRNRLFEEYWQLAIYEELPEKKQPGQTDNAPAAIDSAQDQTAQRWLHRMRTCSINDYRDLAVSNDALWADPHTVTDSGKQFVFFEKLPKHNDPAHIAVATLGKSGQLSKPLTVLQEDHHLSYPFVFQHKGEHYMIPETSGQNKIRLYRATHFPDQWQVVADLVSDINAADTTLFYHQNLWWMFTNCQSHRCVDERDELHLYYAEQLTGPWLPHEMNPVLSGVDRSRMAGSIISDGQSHYRLSQYGAYRYGFGINISRIDELNPRVYRESALHRLVPDPDSNWQGCHTLAIAGRFTIIDRVRYRLKTRRFFSRR